MPSVGTPEITYLLDHVVTGSRGQMETAMPGSSTWMPYAPQRIKGFDEDHVVVIKCRTLMLHA